MSAYDDLLAERYGRDTHAWWKTPERDRVDPLEAKASDLAFRLEAIERHIWKATQETDELEQARERAGRVA